MKRVLIAEDNPGDQELVQLAFESLAEQYEIIYVSDGEELVTYLESNNPFDLSFVLLDLNMPRMSGSEVLLKLSQNEQFSTIPVIIFSSSMHPDDVTKCYMLGANAYVRKPEDFNEYHKTISAISDFWGVINVTAKPAEANF